MTIENAIEMYQDELKEFFNNDLHASLLSQNDFNSLYKSYLQKYGKTYPLTALFIKSDIAYLSKLKAIYPLCYQDLEDIITLNIPNNVERIENRAFENCYNLMFLTLPKSIKRIGEHAFRGCDSLKTIKYLGTKEDFFKILDDESVYTGSYIRSIECSDGDYEL